MNLKESIPSGQTKRGKRFLNEYVTGGRMSNLNTSKFLEELGIHFSESSRLKCCLGRIPTLTPHKVFRKMESVCPTAIRGNQPGTKNKYKDFPENTLIRQYD